MGVEAASAFVGARRVPISVDSRGRFYTISWTVFIWRTSYANGHDITRIIIKRRVYNRIDDREVGCRIEDG